MGYGPRTYRGDPGILGSLWRAGKSLAGSALRGSPVGMAYTAARSLARPGRPTARSIAMPGGSMSRFGPPTGRTTQATMSAGTQPRKRRRINPANPKALRRAIRRQDGFVKLAKKALKGTGYRIVSASSQRKRVQVRESGAGSVTVH